MVEGNTRSIFFLDFSDLRFQNPHQGWDGSEEDSPEYLKPQTELDLYCILMQYSVILIGLLCQIRSNLLF